MNLIKKICLEFSKIPAILLFTWILIGFGISIIIVAVVIFYQGEYRFGGRSGIDMDATSAFGTVIAGLVTPFWTMAGVLIYFKALKDQRNEFSANQIRFEIQQFENRFLNLLERLWKLREEILLQEEYYSVEQRIFKGSDYFSHSLFLMRYLRLALKRKIKFDFSSWEEYEQANEMNLEKEENIDEKYLWEKDPEAFEKMKIDEVETIRMDYSAYKFNLKEDTRSKIVDTEAWYCKFSFQKIYFENINCHDVYYRHLMNLLSYLDDLSKLLKKNDLEERDVIIKYCSYISSNMSQKELAMLFYYSFLFDEVENLCAKYNLFDKLDSSHLLDVSHSEMMKGVKIKNKQEHYDSRKNKSID